MKKSILWICLKNVEHARALVCIISDDDVDTVKFMEQFDKAKIVANHRKKKKHVDAMSSEQKYMRTCL